VGALTLGRPLHAPEIAFDRLMPLEPAWMGVYASLYIFVLLPWIVVRDRALRRRAMQAYIAVLLVSYGGFILYPTIGPRPDRVLADGFAASTLRLQYSLDWPYNCFPSLHVAESFVSALTCFRVHKAVGRIAVLWAALIAVSTVFTKQHYVVDAVAGAALAYAAYRLFLCRADTANDVPHTEQQLAPRRAAAAIAVFVLAFGCAWLADLLGFLPGPEQVASLSPRQ
jgi:membrane-associated phospholipid phosphatase